MNLTSAATPAPDSSLACRPLLAERRTGVIDDPELLGVVTRAQAGDLDAQSQLVRSYTSRMTGFVATLTRHRHLVEDIVQMTFLKMVRKLPSLRDARVFETWLFTLARNTTLDQIRRGLCRIETVSCEVAYAQTPDTSSSDSAEVNELVELLLTRLTADQRRMIGWVARGESYQHVASRLGITLSAVKVRMHRVRRLLRKRAEQTDEFRERRHLRQRLAA